MNNTPWPAWMPEPPEFHLCGDGPRKCPFFRADLLAWYAEVKRRDPDFGYVTAPRIPFAPDVDFEELRRRVFPLPEDGHDAR